MVSVATREFLEPAHFERFMRFAGEIGALEVHLLEPSATGNLAGRADVLLVPTIEAGNILGKAFSWLAGKLVAHVIEGARAPVLIPSRVERADDKLLSIALGALSAEGGE